jgi:hypothetical protein
VALHKLERQPALLESLQLFSQLDTEGTDLAIQAVSRRQAVLEQIRHGLDKSLVDEARLHGWRVQSLFEAMIVGLGSVQLIKTEDAGDCYFDDGLGKIKLPDYRLIRRDGEQLLVEVKNVEPTRLPPKPQPVRKSELDRMQRYAELTGARLVLAHYWSMMNLWTVVDPRALTQEGERLLLHLETAMKANELGQLGDALIASRPPLILSLVADPDKDRSVRAVSDDEEEVRFTVGAVELSSAGHVLTDPMEKRIAWFLLNYGAWAGHEEARVTDEGLPERVEFVAAPAEPVPGQDLEMIGYLSSMYSGLYNARTLLPEGGIRKLRHEPNPDILGNLIPDDYWDQPRTLPLWRFLLQPSLEG